MRSSDPTFCPLFAVLPQSFVPSQIRMSSFISASLLNINNYNCTKAHSFPLTLTNNPEFGHCRDGPALWDTGHWACNNSGTDFVIRFSHSDKYLARKKSLIVTHCAIAATCSAVGLGMQRLPPPPRLVCDNIIIMIWFVWLSSFDLFIKHHEQIEQPSGINIISYAMFL